MRSIFYGFCSCWLLFMTATSVLAAEGGDESGSSALMILFIAFFTLIVVFQMVPAILQFVGMLRGLFSGADQKNGKTRKSNI